MWHLWGVIRVLRCFDGLRLECGRRRAGRCWGRLALSLWLGTGVFACKAGEKPAPEPAKENEKSSELKKKRSEAEWEASYRRLKESLEKLSAPDRGQEDALERGFRDIANHAQDPHLRANACIAAASILDSRKEYASAISYYKQAITLVPREPSPYALMALAQAAQKQYAAAGKTQEEVVRRDPDDLQAWLILGELKVKAKQKKEAAMAYAAYETRRKGLLDGLTKKKQGAYELSPADRIRCVHALEAAPDNGTSLALIYALQSDPSAKVREALVEVFARQRFAGFVQPLTKWLEQEKEASLQARIREAIAHIEAAPVQTRPQPGEIVPPVDAADPGSVKPSK